MGITHLRGYRILLWKAYFDKGFSLTNYFKYFLVMFGWATNSFKATLIIGIAWALSCLLLGRAWFKYKLIETENEVQNAFNPFVTDIRNRTKHLNSYSANRLHGE